MKNMTSRKDFKFWLLVGALFDLFTLFGVLIFMLFNTNFITEVNTKINQYFLLNRDNFNLDFFSKITHLGETKYILVFSLLLLAILLKKGLIKEFVGLLTLTFSSASFILIFKNLIKEPRPKFALITETSYSFPSGHSTIAIAFYGLLIIYLFKVNKLNVKSLSLGFLGILLIGSILLSRLVLGVHYFFDIIGGIILGLICVVLSILAYLKSEEYLKKALKHGDKI